MLYLKFKRFYDFILAFLGIIVLSPIFIVLIIAIKLDSKGPILFKQKRIGVNKTYFNIIKFRTMRIDTPKDIPTHLLDNPDKWITKIGKFLRKTSLDEIPQLFNILMGKMSFVGPRPALWNQYDLIKERDKFKANDILPGITGLAQVSGRDNLLIPDKAKLDGIYVYKMSLFLDIKLVLKTILNVIRKDGIIEGGTGRIENHSKEKDTGIYD